MSLTSVFCKNVRLRLLLERSGTTSRATSGSRTGDTLINPSVLLPFRSFSGYRTETSTRQPSSYIRVASHKGGGILCWGSTSQRERRGGVQRLDEFNRVHNLRGYSSLKFTDMTGKKEKVAIIGSGNWGTAIAKIVGENVRHNSERFEETVRMWVFEEKVDGRKLTEIINEKHENVKYLPGIKLPENVVAVPDVAEAAKGATALIFVLPHQFIPKVCQDLKGKVEKGAKAISLIKGVEVTDSKINIFADTIEEILGVSCCALSGANIANEVAAGAFSETTIGYRKLEEGQMWQKLFHNSNFRVSIIDDVRGVSLCGALKNVVAVAAGLVDGLGWGNNSKAAIMRIGLLEMEKFGLEFFEGVKKDTFVQESAGVADLITSCLGGRNKKCAEEYVKTKKPFEVLEKELLSGQKLQGTATALEINKFLKARGKVDDYPLFKVVYEVVYEGFPPEKITSHL